MKKDMYQQLYLLKKRQEKDQIQIKLDKIAELSEKLNCEENSLKEKYYLLKLLLGCINFIVLEERNKDKTKKILAHILDCSKKNIIYDENDIVTNKDAEIIAGNIKYSSSIDYRYFINKKMVWGDLDLRCLKDSRYLSNLEIVGGNLFLREGAYLPNLKYVYGNIYYEKVNVVLPNLIYAKNYDEIINKKMQKKY